MQIGLFSQQLATSRTGVGTYANALLDGLTEQGHRVTAVVPRGEEKGSDCAIVERGAFDPSPGGWVSLGRQFARKLSEPTAGP